MYEKFDKNFIIKVYKNYREDVLFERELGMMQATQAHVEKEIALEKMNSELEKIQKRLEQVKHEYFTMQTNIRKIKRKNPDKRSFVRKCPNGDCKGFLSTSLKCEICECWVCGTCREVKGFSKNAIHECDPMIVESVKLLEKDSKPCPKCSSLIFKIAGCHQMFCVSCHTAFDWITLKIEKGAIHNPHYFEYMNSRGAREDRMEVDNCNVNNIIQSDANTCRSLWALKDSEKQKLRQMCRELLHINNVEKQRYAVENTLEVNLDLRVKYMRNKIDNEYFKKSIQKREKLNEKKSEIYNVLDMYVTCMADIIHKTIETERTKHYNSSATNNYINEKDVEEMERLRNYTNECFNNISRVYNCVLYKINGHFRFTTSTEK
jgi:hypothetical protein